MKPNWPAESSFTSAAWMLGCETAAIKALAIVESGNGKAFDDNDRPVILYEPHIFSRLTKGRFDGQRANGIEGRAGELSYPDWRKGWYGTRAIQHARLEAAAGLSRSNALKACSWGVFQVLGENHRRCGFGSVDDFVAAMYESVEEHLRAFVAYCWYDRALVLALRRKDAAVIARLYNGPGYKANKYDEKWKAEYDNLNKRKV